MKIPVPPHFLAEQADSTLAGLSGAGEVRFQEDQKRPFDQP
jgi:hypothetical protein